MPNLSYELAKELKDSGFPHKCKKHGGNDGYDEYCQDAEWSKESGEYICIPTLSELIEACGERFYRLTQSEKLGNGWKWVAESGVVYFEANSHLIEAHRTPEEAVARLYLALKKR